MKQTITIKQLNELSDKGTLELNKWVFRNVTSSPNKLKIKGKKGFYHMTTTNDEYLLSIGQMIEFLDDHGKATLFAGKKVLGLVWRGKNDLCDGLWEEVKEVLNGKKKKNT